MRGTQIAAPALVGLVGFGLLAVLGLLHLISSGLVLVGLGLAALVGYLTDRGGHHPLLTPAGLLLGLGGSLTIADLAHDIPLAWAAETGLFGLGLMGIYWAERRHGWALAFGGLLWSIALAVVVWWLPREFWIVGLATTICLASAAIAANVRRTRLAIPAAEAEIDGAEVALGNVQVETQTKAA